MGYADVELRVARQTPTSRSSRRWTGRSARWGSSSTRASHAWTVVGFTVRETPGVPNSTTVLGFYVVGPLGSPTDPWPKKYLTTAQLNTRFTPYHESTRQVVWEGLYVIVAPLSTVGVVKPTR